MLMKNVLGMKRFPLMMEDDIEVNTVEELRAHFSGDAVYDYYESGELVEWLNDRYCGELAEEVERIDSTDRASAIEKLYEVFGLQNPEKHQKAERERSERLAKLRAYTKDIGFDSMIDQIAFSQDELYDLLDRDVKKIYLAGEKFEVPLSVKDQNYIGIKNAEEVCPVVSLFVKKRMKPEELGIKFEDVRYGNTVLEDKVKRFLLGLDITKEYQSNTEEYGRDDIYQELATELSNRNPGLAEYMVRGMEKGGFANTLAEHMVREMGEGVLANTIRKRMDFWCDEVESNYVIESIFILKNRAEKAEISPMKIHEAFLRWHCDDYDKWKREEKQVLDFLYDICFGSYEC